MTPIENHPLRYALANELHARPFPSFEAPATAAFLAMKKSDDASVSDATADFGNLTSLLDHFGAPHPEPGTTHYSGKVGRHRLKWEQHTEFVTFTIFSNGVSETAFDADEFKVFPEEWLAQVQSTRVTSAMIRVQPLEGAALDRALKDWFVPESVVASAVLDGSAVIAGDFRIDEAGHQRFAVFPRAGTGKNRIGRVVQRLCEIETYKAMSMLGLARARRMSGELGEIEPRLTDLIDNMGGDVEAETTLDGLLDVSSRLEALMARASFRFGATKAYQAIVEQRIDVLREERFASRQTFAEFMMRRYDPAMRTVTSTEKRLQTLADRAIRASELLRTKVDVARSAQNQKLLESMDRRADLALRLQETVEGLSVVAISYYGVSLAGYLLYPLATQLGLSKNLLISGLVLPVIGLVWWLIRRIKSKMH